MRGVVLASALVILGACALVPEKAPDRVKSRTVAQEQKVRISAHGRWKRTDDTCFAKRLHEVKLVKRPAHGTVRIEKVKRKPKHCKNRIDHTGVFYTAQAGYLGADEFTYLRVNPDSGRTRLYLIKLEVESGKKGKPKQGLGLQADPELVKEIQRRLADLGYQTGPADGLAGPRTRAAIEAYQKAKGLKTTGEPSAALLKRLKSEG